MTLEEKAMTLYPNDISLREKWIAAVTYLRLVSHRGWILDKRQCRIA